MALAHEQETRIGRDGKRVLAQAEKLGVHGAGRQKGDAYYAAKTAAGSDWRLPINNFNAGQIKLIEYKNCATINIENIFFAENSISVHHPPLHAPAHRRINKGLQHGYDRQ
jgi:hypothetical protein